MACSIEILAGDFTFRNNLFIYTESRVILACFFFACSRFAYRKCKEVNADVKYEHFYSGGILAVLNSQVLKELKFGIFEVSKIFISRLHNFFLKFT